MAGVKATLLKTPDIVLAGPFHRSDPREAGAPMDPLNQLGHIARCGLHLSSSESLPRLGFRYIEPAPGRDSDENRCSLHRAMQQGSNQFGGRGARQEAGCKKSCRRAS